MKWCGLFHSATPEDGWSYINPANMTLSKANTFKTFKEYCEFWDGKSDYIMVEVDDDDLES